MGAREGIRHPQVAIGGQCPGKFGIVLFLARMEAGVFQHQIAAGCKLAHGLRRDRADTVPGKGDRGLEQASERLGHGFQRLAGINALGTAEMGEDDDLAAAP